MIISCVLFSLEAHNIVLVRLVDLRLPHLAGVGGQLVPRGAEHLVVGVHLRLHHELGVRLGYLVLVLQIFLGFQCKYFSPGLTCCQKRLVSSCSWGWEKVTEPSLAISQVRR